jgi:hypothetical protein
MEESLFTDEWFVNNNAKNYLSSIDEVKASTGIVKDNNNTQS